MIKVLTLSAVGTSTLLHYNLICPDITIQAICIVRYMVETRHQIPVYSTYKQNACFSSRICDKRLWTERTALAEDCRTGQERQPGDFDECFDA